MCPPRHLLYLILPLSSLCKLQWSCFGKAALSYYCLASRRCSRLGPIVRECSSSFGITKCSIMDNPWGPFWRVSRRLRSAICRTSLTKKSNWSYFYKGIRRATLSHHWIRSRSFSWLCSIVRECSSSSVAYPRFWSISASLLGTLATLQPMCQPFDLEAMFDSALVRIILKFVSSCFGAWKMRRQLLAGAPQIGPTGTSICCYGVVDRYARLSHSWSLVSLQIAILQYYLGN
jgi:hypothetical protein